MLKSLLEELQEIKDASSAMFVHSLLSSKQQAAGSAASSSQALVLAAAAYRGTTAWQHGYAYGEQAAQSSFTYSYFVFRGYANQAGYDAGYIEGYTSCAGRAPTDVPGLAAAPVEDTTVDVSVIASYGHTHYKPIKWALTEQTRLALADAAPPIIATSSTSLTIKLASGELPAGLTLEDNKLSGTVASLQPYKFTMRAVKAVAGGSIVDERTFEHSCVQGIGGQFGLPDGVQVDSDDPLSAAKNPMVPRNLFLAPDSVAAKKQQHLFWEAVVCGPSDWANFTVTHEQPTRVTQVRFWSHAHRASQHIARVLIYGDSNPVPIAEYGAECRPPVPEEGSAMSEWNELSSAVTLAIPSSRPYLGFRFWFPDSRDADVPTSTHTVSLGRAQLLDVGDGAMVPDGMFLVAPVWDAPSSVVCSHGAPVEHQLRARAAGQLQVTYALAHGAKLPEGLALSLSGLISGQPKRGLFRGFGKKTSEVRLCVRALVGADGAYAAATREITFQMA